MVKSRLLFAILLAASLAGGVAIGLLVGGDRDDHAEAGDTTTTVAPCTLAEATIDAKERAAIPGADKGAALLEDLHVGVDAGCDVVDFTFRAGTGAPGVQVEYSADVPTGPSGHPIPVAGSAFLSVRFHPAAGVDLQAPDAPLTYLGPLSLTPSGSDHVRQVQRVEDFEGVLVWVIGLDSTRPFTVTTAMSDAATVSIRIG